MILLCFSGCRQKVLSSASQYIKPYVYDADYDPVADSILLMNYWLSFKEDIFNNRIDSIAKKIPRAKIKSCMGGSARLSDIEFYNQYNLMLRAWLSDSVLLKQHNTDFESMGSMSFLFIVNEYKVSDSEHINADFRLLIALDRTRENKLTLWMQCNSGYGIKY